MKIITIVGARPQFVKAAAVSRAIAARPGITESIVHTGQHFDANMSDIFFDELGIPQPKHNLHIHGGGHGRMTGQMLEGIETILQDETPDMVLIYGDTNSTLAGALATSKLHIPIAHVEAGLRSFNRKMPEELNRVVTDHLSDLLFCPTHVSVKNLSNEGITNGVEHVGDVMYDAVLFAKKSADEKSNILEEYNLQPGEYGVCTLHRAENTDDPLRLKQMIDLLDKQSQTQKIIFPVHPRTRAALKANSLNPSNMVLIDPIGYMDINRLMASAAIVYTDSGGLQKEAYFHRIPCVTLRDETEWVETVENGWNRLWKHDEFKLPRQEISEYGDGTSADRILDSLIEFNKR